MTANALDLARFGTDLDLPIDPAGSIRIPTSGDVPTISGRDNLLRAVARRLATEPGALVHRPTYGCGILGYVGLANAPSVRSKLAITIRKNLLQDTRLKDVSVTVAAGTSADTTDSGAITVTLVLTLRDDSTAPLTVTIAR